jgi:hypothetical protein
MISVLLAFVITAQQPGELGSYQAYKVVEAHRAQTDLGYQLIPTQWAQVALFSDYNDAERWYKAEPGTALILDSNGLVIFSPRSILDLPLPKPVRSINAIR